MINPVIQTALDEHIAKLAAVGDADQLAIHFQSQNLKAVCQHAQKCAIAQSVTDALLDEGSFDTVHVGIVEVSLYRNHEIVAEAGLNRDVQRFIRNFDNQHYPQLLLKEE